MALRFADSFDHYVTADITKKWSSPSYMNIVAGEGRRGTAAAQIGNNSSFQRVLDGQDTWIIGFAFRGTVNTAGMYVQFNDGSTNHVELWGTGGRPYFRRGGTQIGNVGPMTFFDNVWYYVEIKVVISDTVGVAYLRVNGQDVLSGAGQQNLDTRNGSSTTADRVSVALARNGTLYFDDLYICDGSGSINNTFLGDLKVDCLFPTGAGATTAWTPNTGANYAAVDEAAHDSDTTYVASSTVNQVDTYAMGNLTNATGSVKGVQYNLIAKKDDAGSRSIAPVVRPVATDRVGATVGLSDTYAFIREIAELNPDDSAAWDFADINGLEYGQKLIA